MRHDIRPSSNLYAGDDCGVMVATIDCIIPVISGHSLGLASETKLGPYEILSAIGAGGMGEVYRARDTRLGREVAIKILPESLAAEGERLQRFEQEARAIAALNHPNILSVHDIGQHGAIRYIVTELLDGETLREKLAGGALPQRKAVEYALQIAAGLGAAHQKGIVHRDLKPENLFVTRDGRVKILDFGLAKALPAALAAGALSEGATLDASMPSRTAAGMVLGTVGYMSPEQVRGEPADSRSDIFAFGAVLYESLSGRRAFHRASSVETMTAILKEDVAEIGGETVQVAPAIDRIVRRCLEKEPEQRFQSAKDLAFALEAVSARSGASGVGPAVTATSARRTRNLVGLAVVSLAVVALAFVANVRLSAPQAPSYTQLTFDPGFAGPARFTRDGDAVLYSASWNGGANELFWQRGNSSQSRRLNVDAAVMGIADDGGMAVLLKYHYLASWMASGTLARMPVEGGEPRPILDDVYWADISRDGKNFAVVRSGAGKQRLEYPVGKVLYETPGWLTDIRIAPDGRHIAFLEHPIVPDDVGFVALVDLQGEYSRLTAQNASCHGLAWSSDSKEIWHTASMHGEESGVYAVSLSGKLRTVLRSPIEVQVQDISPSGKVLLESVRYNIEIGVKRDEASTRTFDAGGRTDMSTVSADGKLLLLCHFEGSDYKVYLTRTEASAPLELGDGFGSGITLDNRFVAAMQIAKPHKIILYPTGVGQPREFDLGSLTAAFSGNENGVTFSRDGRLAMFSAFDAAHNIGDYLLELETGKLRPVMRAATANGKLSPDGTRAVTEDIAAGKPVLVDLASGKTSELPGMQAHEEVLGWTLDSGSLLLWNQELPAKIYALNVASGRRQLIETIETSGAVGAMYGRVATSADGKVAAYRLRRGLYALYVADGLR